MTYNKVGPMIFHSRKNGDADHCGFTILTILHTLLFVLFFPSIIISQNNMDSCNYWIDLYAGKPIGFNEMIDDLAGVNVVYIGEIHVVENHHKLQAIILDALYKRNRRITLALEQIEHQNQAELDDYKKGRYSFDEFSKIINWKDQWSNFKDYRSILEAHKARTEQEQFLALNADRKIIKKIARSGFASLNTQERITLPAKMDFSNKAHESLLNKILKLHPFVTPDRIHGMYEAQVSRDEMMAFVIAHYLRNMRHNDGIIVVIGGSRHFAHGLGVPNRVKRYFPYLKDRIIILACCGELKLDTEEKRSNNFPAIDHNTWKELNTPPGDYMHVTVPENQH